MIRVIDERCPGDCSKCRLPNEMPGFDLYAAISACADGLEAFGGHSAAAGLKLMHTAFDDFARRFDDHCRSALTPEHRQKVVHVDAEVPLAALTTRMRHLILWQPR